MTIPHGPLLVSAAVLACLLVPAGARAQSTLEVGPGRPFARIEDALSAAKAGDKILVYPLSGNQPYPRVALLVRTGAIHILAAPEPEHSPIPLAGAGFDYSGAGPTPRAIVQFDPGSDGSSVEGFELSGAHNASSNGAGVRINQASHVTVRSCVIHGNDMGVMSNGNGTPTSAADQRIERCLIYANGAAANPGYSHNLYLGGTSVVLSACEVRSSTTGHNVKSRAHYTRLEYCWVHDSANRELDFVDAAGDTDAAGSDAVVLGCVIAKAASAAGNRGVINFGQDGGHDHRGTLYVVNCTITTPFVSPVVSLSAPSARLLMANTLITDAGSGQAGQVLVGETNPDPKVPLSTRVKMVSSAATKGFGAPGAGVTVLASPVGFADTGACDYRPLDPAAALLAHGKPVAALSIPPCPLRPDDHPGRPLLRYQHPTSTAPRTDSELPAIGAAPLPTP